MVWVFFKDFWVRRAYELCIVWEALKPSTKQVSILFSAARCGYLACAMKHYWRDNHNNIGNATYISCNPNTSLYALLELILLLFCHHSYHFLYNRVPSRPLEEHHGSNNVLSLGQKLQMKLICLLQRNEEDWETENQDVKKSPPAFFFFLFFKSVLKGSFWLFCWSVLGYIKLIYEDVLLQFSWHASFFYSPQLPAKWSTLGHL